MYTKRDIIAVGEYLPPLEFTPRNPINPLPVPHACHINGEAQAAEDVVEEDAAFETVPASSGGRGIARAEEFGVDTLWMDIYRLLGGVL